LTAAPHLLLTTIAAVLLVGCGESQQSAPAPESKPVEPIAEVPAQPSPTPVEAKPVKPVAEVATPEPPTAKAPDISINDAAGLGNIEAVKWHLAAGADVNAKTDAGRTPLDAAIQFKEAEAADLLRKHGGKYGSIHTAAAGGDTEAVKEFLAAGADVNAKTDAGRTPLDAAIQFKEAETADLLRKHGGKTGEELKAEGK